MAQNCKEKYCPQFSKKAQPGDIWRTKTYETNTFAGCFCNACDSRNDTLNAPEENIEEFHRMVKAVSVFSSSSEDLYGDKLTETIEQIKSIQAKGLLTKNLYSKLKEFTNDLSQDKRPLSLNDTNKSKMNELISLVEIEKKRRNLGLIDDILEKCSLARKCGLWFQYRHEYFEELCEEIEEIWLNEADDIIDEADIIQRVLRGAEGESKVEIYQKLFSFVPCISKFPKSVKKLEESDKKYRKLEAEEPRFQKERYCKSQHLLPECEECGWPSLWVANFQKKGIFITETAHWTDKHVWYNC